MRMLRATIKVIQGVNRHFKRPQPCSSICIKSLCTSSPFFSRDDLVKRPTQKKRYAFSTEAPRTGLKDPVIEYTIAGEEHFDVLRDFVTQCTVSWEPMTVGLGGVYEDYSSLYFMLLREILPQNLSVIALDKANNEVAGCILNEMDFPGNIGGLHGFMDWCPNPVQSLATKTMQQLYRGIDLFSKYGVSKVFRQHNERTNPRYWRQGVYTKMMEESLELARLHCYPLVATEFSSHIALRTGRKMGFTVLREMAYADIVIDGQKPYDLEKMSGSKILSLGVKQIS